MKAHYDFSKAKQGAMYRAVNKLRIPVFLDQDVRKKLLGKSGDEKRDLSKLVNDILRTQIEVADLLK